MTIAYVEARPKGRREGEPVEDYVVEDDTDRVPHIAATQAEAIAWAETHGYESHVARVRHLNLKRRPDHWRKV